MKTLRCSLIVVFGLLTGCGGDDEPSCNPSVEMPPMGRDMPMASLDPQSTDDATSPRLVQANSETAFTEVLKARLRNVPVPTCPTATIGDPLPIAAPATGIGDAAEAGGANSDTNTQERGVDEDDVVKFDGSRLFVMATTPTSASPVSYYGGNAIRVMSASEDPAKATELAVLKPSSYDGNINGLYLSRVPGAAQADKLVTVGSTYGYAGVAPGIAAETSAPVYLGNNSTVLTVFDVADSAKMTESWNVQIDGQYLRSRVVNDRLYVATSNRVFINGYTIAPQTMDQVAQNNAAVDQLTAITVLPKIRVNGQTNISVDPGQCYVPVANLQSPLRDLPTLVTITEIDLRNQNNVKATCTFTGADELYASAKAIYLIREDYQSTAVHKFGLGEQGLSYRGSAQMAGNLNGGQPSFRFGEFNDDLRVVTSQMTSTTRKHQLYVLREDGTGDLKTVATLPNAERPDPIGKPGERIYSVRFAGARAYVVTFQKTDPLYVLNLSNPADPFIEGALELPGYSDYLHPIGDNLLLGVGKDAVVDRGITWYQGVKVGLFDVTDATNPQLRGEKLIGKRGTSTPVSQDHHAFTFVTDATTGISRFAMPISVNDGVPLGDPSTFYPFEYAGLHLFEIANGADASRVSLDLTGILKTHDASQTSYVYQANDRSVIQGQAVHFVTGGNVWSAPWGNPASAVGPQ